MVLIAPSLLSADFTDLSKAIASVPGADLIHFDVMDGQFVPNITFGPLIAEAVSRLTDKPLDVHLMINNPENYVEAFAKAGATYITVHAESTKHLHRAIQMVREAGCKPGVALNPATDIDVVKYLLTDIDMVLIMTVNPGFGGQKLIPQTIDKIADLKAEIERRGLSVDIQVDGGINDKTIRRVASAGATIAVAGSFVFGSPNPDETISLLKKSARL